MASLNASGAKSAGDLKESNRLEAEGYFMVAVKEVKFNDKEGKQQDIVETEVIGGTVPGQAGKEVSMFLDRDEKGDFKKRHVRFAISTQILSPGQIVNDVDNEYLRNAIDRFMVLRMEAAKAKTGQAARVFVGGFGDDMWPPTDPEVADVVRAMDGKVGALMQRLTAGGNGGNGNQQGQQIAAQQNAAAQQTSNAAVNNAVSQGMGNASNAANGTPVGAGATGGSQGWDV